MIEVPAVPMRHQEPRPKAYPNPTGEYVDDALLSSNEENWWADPAQLLLPI